VPCILSLSSRASETLLMVSSAITGADRQYLFGDKLSLVLNTNADCQHFPRCEAASPFGACSDRRPASLPPVRPTISLLPHCRCFRTRSILVLRKKSWTSAATLDDHATVGVQWQLSMNVCNLSSGRKPKTERTCESVVLDVLSVMMGDPDNECLRHDTGEMKE
jgi:hypothetical protein